MGPVSTSLTSPGCRSYTTGSHASGTWLHGRKPTSHGVAAPAGVAPARTVLLIDDWDTWEQTFGEVDLTGSVKGQNIEFSFSGDAQGTALKVTYTGTIENKDSMKGKVDLGGVAEGTFTAKRQ